MKNNKIKLVNIRFDQEIEIDTDFGIAALIFGPFFVMVKAGIGLGLLYLLYSIISCGIFWFYIPSIFAKVYYVRLYKKGFRPKTSYDEELINVLGLKPIEPDHKIRIARLDSGDDTFGKT